MPEEGTAQPTSFLCPSDPQTMRQAWKRHAQRWEVGAHLDAAPPSNCDRVFLMSRNICMFMARTLRLSSSGVAPLVTF